MYSIFQAFIGILTIGNRLEGLVGDILEGLRATNVACICINLEQGFDLGYTRNDAADSQEASKLGAAYVVFEWFEVKITVESLAFRG